MDIQLLLAAVLRVIDRALPVSGFSYLGLFVVIAGWQLWRGRITIEGGWSGERRLQKYGKFDRLVHAMMACSMMIVAATGLVMAFGPRSFGAVVAALHSWAGAAFIAAFAVCAVLWGRNALPNRYDAAWLRRGGMMLGQRKNPPAARFNAIQKLMFWFLAIATGTLALTGFGLSGAIHQSAVVVVHAIVGHATIAVVVLHLYVRTIAIEGAMDAMRSGEVDLNWAKQHHPIWAEEALRTSQAAGECD